MKCAASRSRHCAKVITNCLNILISRTSMCLYGLVEYSVVGCIGTHRIMKDLQVTLKRPQRAVRRFDTVPCISSPFSFSAHLFSMTSYINSLYGIERSSANPICSALTFALVPVCSSTKFCVDRPSFITNEAFDLISLSSRTCSVSVSHDGRKRRT